MTRRDTPQSERRQALDAAIAALDEKRRAMEIYKGIKTTPTKRIAIYNERIDEMNRYIRILSDMREEGPLL